MKVYERRPKITDSLDLYASQSLRQCQNFVDHVFRGEVQVNLGDRKLIIASFVESLGCELCTPDNMA